MEILAASFFLITALALPAEPPLNQIDLRSLSSGAKVTFSIEEVSRIGSAVENDRAWILLEPCALPEALPKKQVSQELGLTLKLESIRYPEIPSHCKIYFKSKRPIVAMRTLKDAGKVEVYLFYDEGSLHVFEADRFVQALLAENADQQVLREQTERLAHQAAHPLGKEILTRYFREGTYPLVVASAYGVCRADRQEFLKDLQDLQLTSLFSGTPDESWLQCCLDRFKLYAQLRAENMVLPELDVLEPLALQSGEAGDLISQALWKRLALLERNSDQARKINFLLAMNAGARKNWQAEVNSLERALFGETSFELEVSIPKDVSCEKQGIDLFRVNRINLAFLQAEILRDHLAQFSHAMKIYRSLSQLPKTARFESFQQTENAFAKPAAVEARLQLGNALIKAGNRQKACELWADLAWQEAATEMIGIDEQQSYCLVALKQFDRECGLLKRPILRARSAKFRKSPPFCREIYKASMDSVEKML